MLQTIVDTLYDVVWTYGIPIGGGQYIPWVVLLLLGAGIYFTLRLAFVQIRQFPHGLAVTSGRYDDPDDPGDVSHFQALTTALSATLGIGNIAGAALAIHVGGPGALLWMWVTGILGMATKYSEVTIAQFYRNVEEPTEAEKGTWQQTWKGTVAGGPMYYIEKGLGSNWKPLAIFFAVMLMITSFLTGNAVQSNTVADVMNAEFGVAVWLSGLVLATIIALVILGGVTAIGRVTGILVPVMAAAYVIGALLVLAFNYTEILPTLGSVFTNAFNPSAGVAGTGAGAFLLTFTYGVQRGLFSNEAGMGSAPIAHSAAKTDEPASEGVVALLEPFIDTITVVTLTCLAILVSGAWGAEVPTEFNFDSGNADYRVENEGGIFPSSDTPEEIRIENGEQQVPNPDEDAQFAWRQAVVSSFYTSCANDCDEAERGRRRDRVPGPVRRGGAQRGPPYPPCLRTRPLSARRLGRVRRHPERAALRHLDLHLVELLRRPLCLLPVRRAGHLPVQGRLRAHELYRCGDRPYDHLDHRGHRPRDRDCAEPDWRDPADGQGEGDHRRLRGPKTVAGGVGDVMGPGAGRRLASCCPTSVVLCPPFSISHGERDCCRPPALEA
jgi:AGCS family alanine or glycine:cation symporter